MPFDFSLENQKLAVYRLDVTFDDAHCHLLEIDYVTITVGWSTGHEQSTCC